MSLHFSANQYDRNFQPKLLQNWEVSSEYRQRPRAFSGFTQIVANDRGHLLTGVKRSRESPWGAFIGTWDMPNRIPGNSMTNATARTENATLRLERLKSEGDIILGGKLKQCKVPSPLPVKADVDADKTLPVKVSSSETQLTGSRSGARNPEPVPSNIALAPASPGIRPSSKPCTPNIDWPRPASQINNSNRSGSPKAPSPKAPTPRSPLPPIQSPKRLSPLPNDGRVRTPIHWPAPKSIEATAN